MSHPGPVNFHNVNKSQQQHFARREVVTSTSACEAANSSIAFNSSLSTFSNQFSRVEVVRSLSDRFISSSVSTCVIESNDWRLLRDS